jgi:cytochrome c oxidase subunit 2
VFRVKQDVVPGRYTSMVRGDPNRQLSYVLRQYCGTQHSGMIGRVVVLEPSSMRIGWAALGAAK